VAVALTAECLLDAVAGVALGVKCSGDHVGDCLSNWYVGRKLTHDFKKLAVGERITLLNGSIPFLLLLDAFLVAKGFGCMCHASFFAVFGFLFETGVVLRHVFELFENVEGVVLLTSDLVLGVVSQAPDALLLFVQVFF